MKPLHVVYMYLEEDGNYRCEQYLRTIEIGIIAIFLTSSVVGDPKGFKETVLDSRYESFGSNTTNVYKEGDYIILKDILEEDPRDGAEVTILKTEVIRLLDWWEQVWKHEPLELKLTFDGERFTFQPDYGI